MIDARFEVTDHAVQRYIQRYARDLSYKTARLDLERLLVTAAPTKDKTHTGQSLWRVDDPPMLFVMKPDEGRHVLVTVLPPYALDEEEEHDEDIVAAYERIKGTLTTVPVAVVKTRCEPEVNEFKLKALSEMKRLKSEIEQLRQTRGKLREDVNELVQKAIAAEKKS